MKSKKPPKMSEADIAAIKDSPLFNRKRKEAAELFNSPGYRRHARKRTAIHKRSLKKSSE